MIQSNSFKDTKPVRFYRSEIGREPVRDWLRRLPRSDRKVIGRDILTLQLGWPLGMPLARKLEDGLWEIRSRLSTVNARIIFTVRNDTIVLINGFIKKSRKTPARELRLARQRMERL
jgi:phage-related protein